MADATAQLNQCLDAAYQVSQPWETGVRAAVFEDRFCRFERLKERFKDHEKDIMIAADLTGKVARLCADQFGRDEVSLDDMRAGLAAVLHVCKARVQASSQKGQDFFFLWCT